MHEASMLTTVPEVSNLLLELMKFGFSLLLLAAGWLIGERIIAGWDLRKKRQELDIASAVEFQQLYGELKAVGRAWREYRRRAAHLSPPQNVEWQLLSSAIAAESKYEAVVIAFRRTSPQPSTESDARALPPSLSASTTVDS